MSRIWFITGASRGFGKELLHTAIAHGDIVVGTARTQEQATAITAIAPGTTFGVVLDVCRQEDIRAAFAFIKEQFGRIDVVVNNAGYGLIGALEEVSDDELRRQMETNFFGALYVTQCALEMMRPARSGHILQISSIAGISAGMGTSLYNASKFALEGMSESLAREVAHLGIKVIIIEPGPFRTEWADGSSIVMAQRMIDDYAQSAHKTRERIALINGNQQGSPQKAAELMYRLTTVPHPPVRIPLGRPGFDIVKKKLVSTLEEITAWEADAVATDYDDMTTSVPLRP